jgi:stage II sporulation protein D
MKKTVIIYSGAILSFILIFVVSSVFFGFFGKKYGLSEQPPAPSSPTPTPAAVPQIPPSKVIKLLNNGKIEDIEIEKYIVGVVAAEMPASFETEALKAQAVAARTYTERKSEFTNDVHPDAAVCADPGHCKAYISHNDMETKLGADWMRDFYPKVVSVVTSTLGEIITYNNEPISAVFHSTSSGITENAKDVWGGDVPYLTSVKSEGEEESPRYLTETSFSLDEFKNKINSGANGAEKADFGKSPDKWISNVTKNESGSTHTVTIGGAEFSGTDIRTLLNLRSTNFDISITDKVYIKTKGNGHGVGMSQYGANYMAKQGYGYKDILKKYYTGVEIR